MKIAIMVFAGVVGVAAALTTYHATKRGLEGFIDEINWSE